jgi:uncharacterized alkaline shock family protein YloU
MKGTITVTENALASLLGLAAHEVPGVVGMAPASLKEGIQKILGRAQARDGVVVIGDGPKRGVDLHVVVAFGTNINAVAEGVRQRVQYAAKTFAGIELDAVRVHVVGVSKPGANAPKAKRARSQTRQGGQP